MATSLIAKETPKNNLYETAFEEMHEMLLGDKPLSFKRAVYLTENAYLDGELSYEEFQQSIDYLVDLTGIIRTRADGLSYEGRDRTNVIKAWSIYMAMKGNIEFAIYDGETLDSMQVLTTQPFVYDMEDFWGEKDWSKMFVSKLLATHTGNCHSLPALYKILAEEIEVPAYLALAPNHTYIKQWSQKTGWYNTELTGGSFPFDAHIKADTYIKTEAVAKGIYMDTLSLRHSIAYSVTDLAHGYVKKYGEQELSKPIQWLNVALQYYPNYINAHLLKAELLKKQYQQRMGELNVVDFKELWEDPEGLKAFKEMEAAFATVHDLGYRRMPKEMYLNWLYKLKNDTTRLPYHFETPQPFESLDYEVEIATAGNGENMEFFDQERVVRIGSIHFDRVNNKIVGFLSEDTPDEMPGEIVSRMYDPALGRFWQIDPLADIAAHVNPYHFVRNNPINRIDPTGLTDFKINRETGKVEQVGETNNEPDRIVQTDSDGNVKRKGEGFLGSLVREKNRGKPKIAVKGIKQGFLEDGMDLSADDHVFNVGGEGEPTKAEFEDFALKISDYVDKEIGGFYLANKGESDISYIYMGGFKNNDSQNNRSGFNLKKYAPELLGNVDVKVDYHTHLSRFDAADRNRPSYLGPKGGDVGYKQRQRKNYPNLKFIIIAKPETFEY